MMINKILPLLWLNLFGFIALFCRGLFFFLWCNCCFWCRNTNTRGLQIPAAALRARCALWGIAALAARAGAALPALHPGTAPLGVGEQEKREKQHWGTARSSKAGWVCHGVRQLSCGVLVIQRGLWGPGCPGTPSKQLNAATCFGKIRKDT